MSNLILCHGERSERPYKVAGIDINVYSAEELCYVIAQNAHTLDRDFMDERLCEFIKDQFKLRDLGNKLKKMIDDKKSLPEFILAILEEVHYCDEEEIRNIKQILIESAGLSPSRKHKSRGDNLLKARKFTRALDEYWNTLKRVDADAEPILYASVLHNIGTVYAKLMLYEKAADHYLQAYNLSMDEETLIMYLVCCKMYMKKEEYERMIIRCGYPSGAVESAEKIIKNRDNYMNSANKYVYKLKRLKDIKEDGRIAEYYEEIESTIDEWKREYRTNMILH
ncbi:MAG: hypothetical protein K6E98_06270 [Lachnospiraceae bacterium]|nr:hypothetical protein [Lachnospiraceae bacterium]